MKTIIKLSKIIKIAFFFVFLQNNDYFDNNYNPSIPTNIDDKKTLEYNSSTDPFNRLPLTAEQLVPGKLINMNIFL